MHPHHPDNQESYGPACLFQEAANAFIQEAKVNAVRAASLKTKKMTPATRAAELAQITADEARRIGTFEAAYQERISVLDGATAASRRAFAEAVRRFKNNPIAGTAHTAARELEQLKRIWSSIISLDPALTYDFSRLSYPPAPTGVNAPSFLYIISHISPPTYKQGVYHYELCKLLNSTSFRKRDVHQRYVEEDYSKKNQSSLMEKLDKMLKSSIDNAIGCSDRAPLSMFNYLNLYFPDLSTVSSLAKAADIRVSSRRLIKGTAWENTGRVVSEIQHEISNFAKALKEAVSNSKDGYLNRRRFIFRGKGTQLYFFKIASLRGDF